MGVPYGHPFTIDQAYPFVNDKIVMLGFPDILVSPENSFQIMYEKFTILNADAVIGLYNVKDPNLWDIVSMDENSRVTEILIKKGHEGTNLAWATIIWHPKFTKFLNSFLVDFLRENPTGKISQDENPRELILSDVLNASVKHGLNIFGHNFETGQALDIGTPDGLKSAFSIL